MKTEFKFSFFVFAFVFHIFTLSVKWSRFKSKCLQYLAWESSQFIFFFRILWEKFKKRNQKRLDENAGFGTHLKRLCNYWIYFSFFHKNTYFVLDLRFSWFLWQFYQIRRNSRTIGYCFVWFRFILLNEWAIMFLVCPKRVEMLIWHTKSIRLLLRSGNKTQMLCIHIKPIKVIVIVPWNRFYCKNNAKLTHQKQLINQRK